MVLRIVDVPIGCLEVSFEIVQLRGMFDVPFFVYTWAYQTLYFRSDNRKGGGSWYAVGLLTLSTRLTPS